MFLISGESVSKGIANGEIKFFHNTQLVKKENIDCVEDEIERFTYARETAIGELQVLYEKSVASVGQENALVFGIHQMLIEDTEFVDDVCQMIETERVNAEYAVDKVSKKWEELLQRQKRAEDMRDVSGRLLKILTETKSLELESQERILFVAQDILPSEMIQLDAKKISGIILLCGNANSHSAIFAKAMEIPMIIQANQDWDENYIGKQAIIDGGDGKVYVEADEDTTKKLMEKQQLEREISQRQQGYQDRKTKMRVCANIGSIEEAKLAMKVGADGIGLLRSELLCLKAQRILGEEEQFEIYKNIVEIMDGKSVVIRTWDFGEDKQLEGVWTSDSRGIRWCFEHKDVFESQLRAICRASAYGAVSVLFPMIFTLGELEEAKKILSDVKAKLKQEGILFDAEMKIGVMIETPAAVMISRELAKQVDFCSVGTNDLIQYTFGVGRQQIITKEFYEQCYPMLIELLRAAVSNVHAEGKNIGICGELGAEMKLIETYAKMGMDELSVSSSAILGVREKVSEIE